MRSRWLEVRWRVRKSRGAIRYAPRDSRFDYLLSILKPWLTFVQPELKPTVIQIVEFPELDHPAHAVALKHKTRVLEMLQDLSTQAKARDPRALSESLMLVMDGAWQTARMCWPHGTRWTGLRCRQNADRGPLEIKVSARFANDAVHLLPA